MNAEPDMFKNAGEIAQVSIIERWAWYQAALVDETKIGSASLPIHPGEYHLGYYRTRAKGGQWEPVGIYPDEDGIDIGLRNNKPVTDLANLFTWSCRNPIPYEAYVKALEGGGFDDEPPAPIGHNAAPSDDPFEALRIEYLGEKEQAEEFMSQPVKTQAQADRVAIWSRRLTDIAKRADAQRVAEKEPHLKASRAVDDKWRDLKEEPDTLSRRLKAHIKPFLQEQIRAEEERQRKAREDADRLRREAEEAAQKAREDDNQSDRAREVAAEQQRRLADQARAADAEAEARKVNAGRTGARVGIRTVKVGVVTDYATAAAALVAIGHKDFLEQIDIFAQRAARAGMAFAGMEVRDEEKVV